MACWHVCMLCHPHAACVLPYPATHPGAHVLPLCCKGVDVGVGMWVVGMGQWVWAHGCGCVCVVWVGRCVVPMCGHVGCLPMWACAHPVALASLQKEESVKRKKSPTY